MIYVFSACNHPDALKLLKGFIEHYNNQLFPLIRTVMSVGGIICGGMDDLTFDSFYRQFETYLLVKHGLKLPEVE